MEEGEWYNGIKRKVSGTKRRRKVRGTGEREWYGVGGGR